MTVGPTPRNKGLSLTIRVDAYDNGMISVDGIPINESPSYDQAQGWLGAVETIASTLVEFRKQAEARKKQQAAIAESTD